MTHDEPTHDQADDHAAGSVPETTLVSAADLGADVPVDAAAIAATQQAMRLVELAREIEKHVAAEGWDQNPRMFALARTAELVALEPALAEALGAAGEEPDSLTPIEQDALDLDQPLDDVLATTLWPEEVVGAALVLERLVLPPEAESALPDGDQAAFDAAVAAHPERQDVRMAVVVTRDGRRICAIRLRTHDVDDEVLIGADLVPRLADALAATFA